MARIDSLFDGLSGEILYDLTAQQDDYIFMMFTVLNITPEEFMTRYVFETGEIKFEASEDFPQQLTSNEHSFKLSQEFRIRLRTPEELQELEEAGGIAEQTVNNFKKALKVYKEM